MMGLFNIEVCYTMLEGLSNNKNARPVEQIRRRKLDGWRRIMERLDVMSALRSAETDRSI